MLTVQGKLLQVAVTGSFFFYMNGFLSESQKRSSHCETKEVKASHPPNLTKQWVRAAKLNWGEKLVYLAVNPNVFGKWEKRLLTNFNQSCVHKYLDCGKGGLLKFCGKGGLLKLMQWMQGWSFKWALTGCDSADVERRTVGTLILSDLLWRPFYCFSFFDDIWRDLTLRNPDKGCYSKGHWGEFIYSTSQISAHS